MKRLLLTFATLAAVAMAACRIYDVDVYKNVNATVPGDEGHGVSQSFTCTADSLLWAEFFVGAGNDGGKYIYTISAPNGAPVFYGEDSVRRHYDYSHADLHRWSMEPLIKGKTYVLKITQSNPNQMINFYYSDQNPYPYGMCTWADTGHSAPLFCDLCCRIAGIV